MLYDEVADKILHEDVKSILNALPDIASTVMNEEVSWDEENKENEQHIESVFSEIKMNEVPENLLNSSTAVELFIEWEMLKSCNSFDEKIVWKVLDFIQLPQVMQLFESLFWLVNILKFQNDNVRLIKKLRRKLSTSYTTTLSLCPLPKEEVLALTQFCFGYMVHMMHHRIFPKQRQAFTVRFLLDCYHIVLYELTGLLISDVYVYNQIEKIFGERFFLYKQEGILDLTNVDLYEGSTYVEKTAVRKQDMERLRMTKEFNDIVRKEIAEFGAKLSDKFAHVAHMLHANTKPNLLMAKYEGELAKKIREITQKDNFQEIVISRAKKINDSQIKSSVDEFRTDGSQRNMESMEAFQSKDELSKSKKMVKKSVNSSSLPVLKIKQKFDCSQVSPPLQLITKNVTAATKKKTIAFTSFNVPDFSTEKLKVLFDKHLKLQEDKKKLREKKEKELKDDGPFNERNIARFGSGSENLHQEGLPEDLRKKFTEFYVIRNVRKAKHRW